MLQKMHLPNKLYEDKTIKSIQQLEESSKLLREVYTNIIDGMIEDKSFKVSDFESNNYEQRRIFNDGMIYALTQIKKVLND